MSVLYDKYVAVRVAKSLLELNAVKLSPEEPFKWTSGWKSPIYCDNRLTLSHSYERSYFKHSLLNIINSNFIGVEAIAGVATAGIPQGVLLAEALNLPFIYVRPKPKDHGMQNMIEGKIIKGQKIVVVEDLVSTGGSSLKAVESLKDAGFEVLGMVAMFTYGFPVTIENFKKAGVKLFCLSDYETLIQVAVSMGCIKQQQLVSLEAWRENPAEWLN